MVPKAVMIHCPTVLMYSIQDRLVPRWSFAALDINEAIDIAYILRMSGELFDRYILRFRGNVETLLVAYKGHYLQV
ncbi:hypothetical protein HN873_046236 [Arachis hypogaea]